MGTRILRDVCDGQWAVRGTRCVGDTGSDECNPYLLAIAAAAAVNCHVCYGIEQSSMRQGF